jgi:peptidoglycan/xylan/chitin deacetylase (PgdA/CDA1 family)
MLRLAAIAVASAPLMRGATAQGAILGPYTPDENTLHLWHMDDPAVPVLDSTTAGQTDLGALGGGATLGNVSFIGFGNAVRTYTGNATESAAAGQAAALSALPLENGPGDNVSLKYAGESGTFTYEAIIRIDFDPAHDFGPDQAQANRKSTFMQIICADAEESADRLFQFRLVPVGGFQGNPEPFLEFINIHKDRDIQNLSAPIPTSGPDAIRPSTWYHVAVVYDGKPDQADNLKFYWTLLDPSRTSANLIGTAQMKFSLSAGCSPDLAIGQTGREGLINMAPNNNFVGLIDEVRMSDVARAADQMMFGDKALAAKPAAAKPAGEKAGKAPAPAADPPKAQTARASAQPNKESQDTPKAPVTDLARPSAPATNAVASSGTQPAAAPAVSAFAEAIKKDISRGLTLRNGAIVRGSANQRRLALLFSCRISDEGSAAILDALKSHQAKASFFVTRDFLDARENALLLRRMVEGGHFVGPHSDSWSNFANAGARRELAGSQVRDLDVEAHLEQLTNLGIDCAGVRFFLAPLSQINEAAAARGRACGLTMIMGTPGTLSFANATVEGTAQFTSSKAILESILSQDRQDKSGLNGYLLPFHFSSGSKRKDKFAAHVAELVEALHARGYELVRVDELLGAESGK